MKLKKIILMSHCVLNQNSVVESWSRAKGAFPITEILLREGIGIIQLPCPELIYKGINRLPLNYEDYDTKEYRTLCQSLLAPYITQIKDYIENGYSLLGVIAVHNSPTCSISGKRGVFMEELFSACEREKLDLHYVEIPEEYNENSYDLNLWKQIINLIKEN